MAPAHAQPKTPTYMIAFRVHLTRTFFNQLAQSLVFTTWMLYQIQVIGLDPLQLVLVGTVMELAIFFFEIPTGVLADVYSRRLSVIIGTLMMGFAYLLMGAVPTFAATLLSQLFWGIGYTFTSGAYDAWMVDEIGQERAGEGFLRGTQMGQIAGFIGIFLSTLLAVVNLALPILFGGVLQILTGLWLIFRMPERGFSPTPSDERVTWRRWLSTFVEGTRAVRQQPTLIRILGIGFFLGFFSEAWDRLWQAHLIDNVGLPGALPVVVWIGLLTAGDALLGLTAIEALQRRVDMTSARQLTRLLLLFIGLMIVAQIGFALSSSFLFAILVFYVFTIARGLIDPLFNTWTNQHIDSQVRATVLSMRSQTDAIGQISGGPPLGALGQRSLRLALTASALTLSPALALLMSSTQKSPQAKM